MGLFEISKDTKWWFLTIPAIHEFSNVHGSIFTLLCIFIGFLIIGLMGWAFSPGGPAWKNGRNKMGRVSIPGPRGLPIFGSLFSLSCGLAHRTLARMASAHAARQLMAFSLGSTPAVVASEPNIAREILTSPHFGNRPIKHSAKQLMFSRAIGFAPSGAYWRMLRRTVSTHLFSLSNIVAHEPWRQLECAAMVNTIATEQADRGFVVLRKHLQAASLNNIMDIVFGKRYDLEQYDDEAEELHEIVGEGFELLGAFNWSDHLPLLKYFFDPFCIEERCALLVPRVKKLIKQILKEHQTKNSFKVSNNSDFIHVLLSLHGDEKLDEDDMVAILWEMVFRGTDTTALLTEWVMAELVLNPHIQTKLRGEIENLVRVKGDVTYADISKIPYLNAVVKETLRLHPPGPLLSWARLSTADVHLSNGMIIPANTTAMVNMWAITHDPNVWDEPLIFKPERFIPSDGGVSLDVRGNDLRLAPFGAGIRVCPGKSLGLATVNLWVAKLVSRFLWVQDVAQPVDVNEVLKLSCEMKKPLSAVAIPRAI